MSNVSYGTFSLIDSIFYFKIELIMTLFIVGLIIFYNKKKHRNGATSVSAVIAEPLGIINDTTSVSAVITEPLGIINDTTSVSAVIAEPQSLVDEFCIYKIVFVLQLKDNCWCYDCSKQDSCSAFDRYTEIYIDTWNEKIRFSNTIYRKCIMCQFGTNKEMQILPNEFQRFNFADKEFSNQDLNQVSRFLEENRLILADSNDPKLSSYLTEFDELKDCLPIYKAFITACSEQKTIAGIVRELIPLLNIPN